MPGVEEPAYFWFPDIAPSGMMFYTGDRFPAWKGNLFVGGMDAQVLVRLVLNGEKVVAEERLLNERHQRVRAAAVLCTLPAEHAGLIGAQTELRGSSRDHVQLAAEVRHPEAVNDIGRRKREDHRTAGRNADLVGAIDGGALVLVHHAPPPLRANHAYAESARIRGRDGIGAGQPQPVAQQER